MRHPFLVVPLLFLAACGGGRIVNGAPAESCSITPSTMIVTVNSIDQIVALVCVGDTVPTSTNPATTTASTSAPTTSSTSPTSTSAPTTTTTTTTPPSTSTTATTVPGSGQFSDGFANLNNWTYAHWRNDSTGQNNTAAPSSASVVNSEAQIVTVDQEYGDGTLRSNTLYSATGEIRVTLRDNANGLPLLGSAFVAFTPVPLNAPSVNRDNGQGPTPQSGTYIYLRDNCRVFWGPPQGLTYNNYNETIISGDCFGNNHAQPTGPIEMRYNNGKAEFFEGGGKYAELNVPIPASGYFMLGVHNHASVKYGPQPNVTGWFDDVSYPSAGTTVSYRNGQGVIAVGPARVVFDAFSASNVASATVSVNGHPHVFAPHNTASHCFAESVAIPASDLVVGNNAIVITGFAFAANVDLIVG